MCIAFRGFELIETLDEVVKSKVFTNVYDIIMLGCCNLTTGFICTDTLIILAYVAL